MPATPTRTIENVLEEFLAEQDGRLSPATFRKYASSVELLWMHLNGYGYEDLSDDELERFERAFNEEGDEEAFCHLFGPEKIVEQIPHFLYWFMLRKVFARESDLLAAAATSRKLVRWLVERDYVNGESAELALEAAASARNDLPAADKLSQVLHDHTGGMFGPEPPKPGARIVEDYLTIERTEPGALWFEGGLGPLRVPDEAAELAKPGWGLWAGLACEGGRWRLLEHGIVYP
jgi:hypothetical protein